MTEVLPFLDHPLTDHMQVIERAKAIGRASGLSRVVVAAAEEDDLLAAMYKCRQENISDAVLVGNETNVRRALDLAEVPEEVFELIPTENDEESALKTAQLAGSGSADVVMKGYLKTGTLLKTLLKSEHGLRDRELLTHSALLYVPKYGKLLNITDGGTIPAPTIDQKLVVIANAVRVLRSVGVSQPKVAVIAPSEAVIEQHPETLEARRIVDISRKHWSGELEISGPLPFDLVINKPGELGLERRDPVAGDADILIVHTLEEGNIIAKTLIQFGDAVFMGVIAGAKVPISLVSRSDSMMNKMASVALAVCLADYQRRDFPALAQISPEEIQ